MKLKTLAVAVVTMVVSALTAVGETVATASWIGAGDRANPNDPANWVCKDAGGTVIADAIPTTDTIVTIAGETNFNLPLGTKISAKKIVFENPKLTAPADWRGGVDRGALTSYTPIEYIMAPAGAYIDTLFNPNEKTRVVMEVEVQSSTEYWFGTWNDGYSNGAFAMGNDGGNVYIGYGTGEGGGNGKIVPNGKHVIVELNRRNASITDVADGTVYNSKTFSEKTFQCRGPLYLFAQNRTNEGNFIYRGGQKVKMYACQIYDNDVLVRDFIPVKWEKTYCLWDDVTKTFFTGDGTSVITSDAAPIGDPVEVQKPAENACSELAYIDVPGKEFIYDTEFVANQDSRIAMTIEPKTNWEFWFGAYDGGYGSKVFAAGSSAGSFYTGYAFEGGDRQDGIPTTDGTVYKYVPENKISTVDMNKNHYSVTTDGEVIYTRDFTYREFSTVCNVILFGRNAKGTPEFGYGQERVRMYGCKIYDNDVLVHDYVPAILGKKIGLYDRVTKTFGEPTRVSGSKALSGGSAIGTRNLPLDNGEEKPGDPIAIDEGVTIDLNGQDLSLLGGTLVDSGLFTVTTTAAAALTIDVAEGAKIDDQNIVLDGGLKLVKAGAGSLLMYRGSQKYTGGTDINGGVLQSRSESSNCDFSRIGKIWWPTVTINEGGTYDINGSHSFWGYHLLVNGGTIANTHAWNTDGQITFFDTTLKTDTTFDLQKNYPLNGDRSKPMNYDLGNKTLTVNAAKDATFTTGWVQFHDGTLVMNGYRMKVFKAGFEDGKEYAGIGGENFTLVMNAILDVRRDFTLDTLVMNAPAGDVTGTSLVTVKKTLKSMTDNMPNIQLASGATLDLSARETVLPLASACGGDRKLTFEAQAKITVDWGERAVEKNEKLVSWTEKPSARFVASPEMRAKGYSLKATNDGLYAVGNGMTIIVR